MIEFLRSFWDGLSVLLPGADDVVKDLIKALLVLAITALAGWMTNRLWRMFKRWRAENDALDRLSRARNAVRSNDGIWLTKPLPQPANYEHRLRGSIPIITLANLKGGVGKTTVTANLAGAFAFRGENVLVIDLDFQGSLTSMTLDAKRHRPGPNDLSIASQALLGGKDPNWLIANAAMSPKHANISCIPAFYDLARVENQLLVEWLIKDKPFGMPYTLAELLTSDAVQQRYHRILIDAPPRLSPSCVQALCASTHLLIPTVMDQLSSEAVTTFINEVEALRAGQVCPCIKHIGIVGTMLPSANIKFPQIAAKSLQDQLKASKHNVEVLPDDAWINDIPALGRAAGQTIAVVEGATGDKRDASLAFSGLVDVIAAKAPRTR